MSWLSVDDYINQFGVDEATALTDRSNTSAPDEALISAAIMVAQSLAISYLGDRADAIQSLPETPAVLVNVLADLARYALYDAGAPEEVTVRRAGAISWLRDVAAGRATLITTPVGTHQPVAASEPRQFGHNLRGF